MAADGTVYVVTMACDRTVGESIKALLDSAGYLVCLYESGDDFISSYKPGSRACLIVDVGLPDRSALRLIKDLPNMGIDIPIVVTAEYDPENANAAALPVNVEAYLLKPFKEELLVAAIDQVLASAASQ